ncbi:hypothetical protein DUI87_10827 [Hirundo rustica rustica]|uniref:PML-like coiled-coil domain-containing protein n=1 Tax=Hirundo rustica rustica TaxID=333673 RepID=A0A3M0KJ61_HIRRU|nr:hypothetical protein DUI87_10827 [Hirundo rustica rustica]
MLREAPAGTRKNIPAAKKMDYPAAGGNPTGEGWSRGIGLWVTLVILSQAMCPTNGLHEPQEGMGMETNLPTVPPNLTRNRVLESRVRVDWFTPKRGENRQWNGGVKLNKSNHPMATARKRREVSSLPLITTCKECNKTVWIGGKKESTFVGYLQVNPLCYDKRKLKMCALNGKTYWVGQNEKLQTATLANGPILLDMLGENDERVCLRMDKVFCFSKDEEGLDPENKIQKVALEFKRQELAAKKKRMEQERMRTLSEQYDQLEKQSNDWSLATSSKNLFLDLVQEIATELGLTNCWICGGLKSAERWPWKGESLTPEQLLKWDNKILNTLTRPGGWTLDERVIGTICISREGNVYSDVVGYTPCLSTLAVNSNNRSKMWQPEPPNGYWGKEKQGKCNWVEEIELCWHELTNANPYYSLTELVEFWDKPENIDIKWKAPSGIYWICGKRAYSELPRKWKGSCTLGMIRPSFFTLPRTGSNLLGAPLYETLSRRKREVKKGLPQVGGNQKWGEEEWPAERIIEYYGPATWAQDGSWGYRTPVYLLNRLIRLQAVVEIVSNHTSDALELLAKQHSQMRAFVYQNRIALDYLLAEEGGVCGKFNDSECCIEINDYGETIRDLAAEIKKVAHVPVQKWNSILKASWWDQIFGTGDWWKKVGFFILCSVAGTEQLQQLVEREAKKVWALLMAWLEHSPSGLAEELCSTEGILLWLEAAKRLVERLGCYSGEQELMDMKPFVKGVLLALQQLQLPEPPELCEPTHFVQCQVQLWALVERVTGQLDVPEVKATLENNLEEDPIHPKTQSVFHIDQPLLLPWYKRPFPCLEKGSHVSPKILRLECNQEPGPSHPESHWEFWTELSPSTL